MGMTEAILFGMLSLTLAVIAAFAVRKLPLVSVLSGLLTDGFVVLSAYHWYLALVDSGKNPAWLGFARYPLVLIVYIALFVLGTGCIAAGMYQYRKGKRN